MFLATACSLIVGYVTYDWIVFILVPLWILMIGPTYRELMILMILFFVLSGNALILIAALLAGNRWAIGLDEENAR